MSSGKILIWYWGLRGGGLDFTYRLVQKLAQILPTSRIIVSLSLDAEQMDVDLPQGILMQKTRAKPRRKGFLVDFVKLPFSLLEFVHLFHQHRPQYVLITMNAPWAWPLLVLICKFYGAKLKYVAHDANPHAGDYARKWQSFTQKKLLKAADTIIALSRYVAGQLDVQNVTVLPLQSFMPKCAKKMHFVNNPKKLLFAGRLLPYKGLDALIEILKYLPQEGFILSIIGYGPPSQELEILGHDPRVRICNVWLDHSALLDAIADHDCLLCPYSASSQSGIVAHAISQGTPVIAFNVGAMSEQIRDCSQGTIIPASDYKGFAEAIRDLLSD